jgi:proteasome lid subunit RPN8/RPN11
MAIQIPRNVLELILHASRSAYPNEFGAMIRGEGNRIKEVLLLPGTVQGRRFASFNLNMLPLDSKAIGVVHSHPSGSNRPSEADLLMFSKRGNVNLIIKAPYQSVSDVAGYDKEGVLQEIEIID